MNDRNEYPFHTHRANPARQHYAEANAPTKPRVPTWVKLAAIVACIGLAGGLTGCGGGGSAAPEELEPAVLGPIATAYGDGTWMAVHGGKSAIDHASDALGRQIVNKSTGDNRSSPGDVYHTAMAGKTAPEVVLLGWGINDQVALGEVLQSIFYSELSIELKAVGKTVVIVESTPIVAGGVLSNAVNEYKIGWKESGRLATEARKRQAAIDHGAYYCAMPKRTWTLTDKPDGINLSADAAKWLGVVIADCIKTAVK